MNMGWFVPQPKCELPPLIPGGEKIGPEAGHKPLVFESEWVCSPHSLSPSSPRLSPLAVLGFHISVTKKDFSSCIFREQQFRVAILSHMKKERLVKLDQIPSPPSTRSLPHRRWKPAKPTQFRATNSTIIPLGHSLLFYFMPPSLGRHLVIFVCF